MRARCLEAFKKIPGLEIVVPSEELTGIARVESQREQGVYYNLNGQKVAHPTRGIYIYNGKKIFVK